MTISVGMMVIVVKIEALMRLNHVLNMNEREMAWTIKTKAKQKKTIKNCNTV